MTDPDDFEGVVSGAEDAFGGDVGASSTKVPVEKLDQVIAVNVRGRSRWPGR